LQQHADRFGGIASQGVEKRGCSAQLWETGQFVAAPGSVQSILSFSFLQEGVRCRSTSSIPAAQRVGTAEHFAASLKGS